MSATVTWKELLQDIENFIAFKRHMGFSYKLPERSLRRFQRFVKPLLRRGPRPVRAILNRYIEEHGNVACQLFARDFSRVRDLCTYRRRRDSRAYIPTRPDLPRRQKCCPYLLTNREVQKTLTAARSYCGKNPKCSGETAYLLVLICYCTGLRIGEATRLKVSDVDVQACTFCIRNSKRKTRIVPFHRDLSKEIKRYLHSRAASGYGNCGIQPLLLDARGQEFEIRRAWKLLALIWRQLGLKPRRGRAGPRPTDLRHAFARDRLSAWYRKGVNLDAQLPWLSAYMGHNDLLGTEVYLHTTPELMRAASRRFERRFRQVGSA